MNITTSEKLMLQNIGQNNFGSGDPAAEIWSDCLVSDGPNHFTESSIPGVVSSLSKKGLVKCLGEGKDAGVQMTEKGLSVYREFFPSSQAPGQPEKKSNQAQSEKSSQGKKTMNIQSMLIEDIAKNINDIPSSQIIEFYNAYSGQKAIKKFRDRATAETKLLNLVEDLKAKKEANEKKKAPKAEKAPKAPKAPSISLKGSGVVAKMREMKEGYQDNSFSMEDLENELDTVKTSLEPVMASLIKAGWVETQSTEDEDGTLSFSLTEQGLKGDIKPNGKMPGSIGKKSKFSGKIIHLVDKVNPRREGTHGWHSFNIILNNKGPMKYEDYLKAGGRANDLNCDVDRERLKLTDK